MSCCGRARARAAGVAATASSRPPAAGLALGPPQAGAITFEYVGQTGLTARGGVTGAVYRFDRPGARVAVDPRDLRSLLAVPVVRRVGR